MQNHLFSVNINKPLLALVLGSILAAQTATSQDTASAPASPPAKAAPDQPSFDLSFPGGSPQELVTAIVNASGRPLNALIPEDATEVRIPPMKFKVVTVPEIFAALRNASRATEIVNGNSFQTYYGFQTESHSPDGIWYFQHLHPPAQPEFCRFYQLSEDLERYSIQDITTAIQTGWKMLGVKNTPTLKFHPETKLLIAVGPLEQLKTIEDALRALRTAPPVARSAEKKDGTAGKQ
jgi:hypothetical protein